MTVSKVQTSRVKQIKSWIEF